MRAIAIANSVGHNVKGAGKVSSFFVVEADPWDALLATRSLHLDTNDMLHLVDWLKENQSGRPSSFYLLISINGKHGIVRNRQYVDGWANPLPYPTLFHFDEAIKGTYQTFKKALDKRVSKDPSLVSKYNLKFLNSKATPRRLDSKNLRNGFSIEKIHAEVVNGMANPEFATDDALFWMAVAGPTGSEAPWEFDHDHVWQVLEDRLSNPAGISSNYVDFSAMTMVEVYSRAVRARRTLEKFLEYQEWMLQDQIEHWIKSISNDKLAEVTFFTSYCSRDQLGQYKAFLFEFQARFASDVGI